MTTRTESSKPSVAEVIIDTLRQPDRALLTTLAEWERKNPSQACGEAISLENQLARTVVRLVHPQLGASSTQMVKPRRISTDRANLIIGSYVYSGTRCSLVWRTENGEPTTLIGTVRTCNHVEGRLHIMEVDFDVERVVTS